MRKDIPVGVWLTVVAALAVMTELLHHRLLPDSLVAMAASLPGFLPSLLLTLLLLGLWRALALPALWLPALLLLAGEGLQATGWIAGAVFDPLDLAAIGVGSLLMAWVPLRPWRLQVGHKPALLVLPLLVVSQLACYTQPEPCIDDGENCSTPIFLTLDEIRAEIVPEYGNTATLLHSGKLYQLDNWLAVVDTWRGLHIFDVTDSQNPIRVVYLPIPGITDLEVKNNYLYVNAFVDLVTISLTDLQTGSFSAASVQRLPWVLKWQTPESFYEDGYFTDADMNRIRYYDSYFMIGFVDPNGTTWLYGEPVTDEQLLQEVQP